MKQFTDVFKKKKSIIGVLHLKGNTTEDIRERAKREADMYLNGGLDGIIAEDYFNSYTHLEWVLSYLSDLKPGVPIGVNCLNFDSLCFELARDHCCDFLQLDSVIGHVKPRDEDSMRTMLDMERSRTEALLLGGVRFKYQPVLSEKTLEEDLEEAKNRCDAVCVTGDGTGMQTPMEKLQDFRNIIGDFPLVICSGLNEDNCAKQMQIADAAIVGSFFKDTGRDTGEVDPARIKRLLARLR